MDDIRFMREALSLAEKGRGLAAPNPVVGCVIVKDETIVGRGYHRKYGACHAEVAAIRDAKRAASGATMYVTLQPCNHFGKTPPCTDAIVKAGIKRLVIAADDPNPKTKCAAALRKLQAAGIAVESGLLRAEALRQNEVYFHNLEHDRPFVALKLALTLDGKLADFQGKSQWITAESAREYVHHLRGEYAAILVGQRTVQADDPRLTCRVAGRQHPLRVVLDPDLSLPVTSRVFTGPGRTMLFCAPDMPASRKKPLRAKGVEIREVSVDHDGLLLWTEILAELAREKITSVMVEGGAKVTASALGAGIVNKLYLFFAPMILGGGVSFSEELVPRRLDHAIRFREWRALPIGPDLLIEAYL